MKKGIIMEIDDVFLTLLTPEGEFLRTKKQDQIYSLGEEIHFFPMANFQTKKSFFLLKNILSPKTIGSVLAALIILFGSLIPMHQNNKAYAYMSIDANSSIELGVNKKMQVVELTGFNKEGQKVIAKLKNWKKKDVSKITKSILAEIQHASGVKNEPVILSTVRVKEQDEHSEKELQKNIAEIKALASKEEMELTVLKATQADREKAHNLGISTGKYQEDKHQPLQKEEPKNINVNQKPNIIQKPNANLKQNANLIQNANQKQNIVTTPKSVVIPPGQQKKNEDKHVAKPVIGKPVNSKIAPVVKEMAPGQIKKFENQSHPKQGYTKPKTQPNTQHQTHQEIHVNSQNHSNGKGGLANQKSNNQKDQQNKSQKNK
ncbi:anti-sigma factor domain-containing protein [Neobacillus cucumis]|uniref:RsgI N-terminal anti-sigma domain-containing protein n=1 Tax=Neobacillus cucumis TaxID=1740721 RepID=A0A2N5HBB6_9BACI|nr:anti-sigma factor domain-containing protein [Neobacillus cucumis]PLS02813.1 hypothetical protein CVD27_16605 [Neobacillus cucumis]